MENQAAAKPKFSAYDGVMDLLREQISALQVTRESLARCQAENKRLIEGYRFYADRDNWRQRTAQMDNGAKAREILKGVVRRKENG
jgi:Asp-tRNA(Asn)/Glu-tRNA(Gln) amidotransferase A subunit family amidase